MLRALTVGQMELVRGPVTMAAPSKYPLELRERAVRLYRTTEPRPQTKRPAVDVGVHPEACGPGSARSRPMPASATTG